MSEMIAYHGLAGYQIFRKEFLGRMLPRREPAAVRSSKAKSRLVVQIGEERLGSISENRVSTMLLSFPCEGPDSGCPLTTLVGA